MYYRFPPFHKNYDENEKLCATSFYVYYRKIVFLHDKENFWLFSHEKIPPINFSHQNGVENNK